MCQEEGAKSFTKSCIHRWVWVKTDEAVHFIHLYRRIPILKEFHTAPTQLLPHIMWFTCFPLPVRWGPPLFMLLEHLAQTILNVVKGKKNLVQPKGHSRFGVGWDVIWKKIWFCTKTLLNLRRHSFTSTWATYTMLTHAASTPVISASPLRETGSGHNLGTSWKPKPGKLHGIFLLPSSDANHSWGFLFLMTAPLGMSGFAPQVKICGRSSCGLPTDLRVVPRV